MSLLWEPLSEKFRDFLLPKHAMNVANDSIQIHDSWSNEIKFLWILGDHIMEKPEMKINFDFFLSCQSLRAVILHVELTWVLKHMSLKCLLNVVISKIASKTPIE